jgi:uncharacterized membrane protein YoaK (UPF0700 family)
MGGSLSRTQVRKEREQAWLALLLAWVAGGVDAVGYLALLHLFTAHMSGNTAALGAFMGSGQWATVLHRALPIPLFVIGVMVGAFLSEYALRRRVRSPFALILTWEAALLLLFMVCGNPSMRQGVLRTDAEWKFYLLAALPSLAMGMQNATLRRVGSERVRTTYVSGMLTNMAENGVDYLLWLRMHTRGRDLGHLLRVLRLSARQPALNRLLLFGGIWTAFFLGAILGGYAEAQWKLWSLLFPLGGLLIVIVVDAIQPIAPPQAQEGKMGAACAKHKV